MEKYFNFEKNFNFKLSCNYFTTIRSISKINDDDISVNDIVDIRLRYLPLCYAEVVSIEIIDLNSLTSSQKTLLSLDTGFGVVSSVDFFRKLYKSDFLALITLRRI